MSAGGDAGTSFPGCPGTRVRRVPSHAAEERWPRPEFRRFFWEFPAVPRVGEIFSAPLSEQLQHSREQSQVREDDNEM
ncbi:RWD domain-containing protein 2B [Manis javanica]|nr:RWD domain-containing protein 2B [Manis javanica]